MDLTSHLDFAAPPERVAAMYTERGFLERVCAASEALDYTVGVTGDVTHTSRTLSSPDAIARFAGARITVTEEVRWGPADASGGRTAAFALRTPGLPVVVDGSIRLAPGGRGTTLTYAATLSVGIPLLGPSLEKSAAPLLIRGLGVQQEVGDTWLGDA